MLALASTFRRHGFEGASLSVIRAETGLGRGSLYHFFPDGKADMATAVLDHVHAWFEREVYATLRAPVRRPEEALAILDASLRTVEDYFSSRERVCLFAAMSLGDERASFAPAVRAYFADWIDALADLLVRGGASPVGGRDAAIDVVGGIQGALILSRALDDTAVLTRALARQSDVARAAIGV